jgi:hypothetical protein
MKNLALVDVVCREVIEWMTDYMTPGVMAAPERAQFELHLHACTWCMTYFKQMVQTAHSARSCVEPEPEPATAEPLGAAQAQLLARFRVWSASTAAGAAKGAVTGAVEPPLVSPSAAPLSHPTAQQEGAAAASGGLFFKFLARGARGSISAFDWPVPAQGAPGAWVEAAAPLVLCERGIHACRGRELAHWLDDELWVIELAGELQEGVHGVVAARGRLVRKVEEWSSDAPARFGLAAYRHAEELASADPAAGAIVAPHLSTQQYHLPRGNTALAAFCAAMAAARLSGRDHFDQAAYDRERLWQSAWLVRELGLGPAAG